MINKNNNEWAMQGNIFITNTLYYRPLNVCQQPQKKNCKKGTYTVGNQKGTLTKKVIKV